MAVNDADGLSGWSSRRAEHRDLASVVAELLGAVRAVSLAEAAARYVADGVPVFPCVPGGKRPLTEHGFHDATADARRVDSWWRRWPTANIGMPTGAASGVDVVDVDQKGLESGYPAFSRARRHGLGGGWLALVSTPSGGMHAYYPSIPGRPQASWQAVTARVDFRGDGGYVVVPPSLVRRADGVHAGYTLVGERRPVVSPVDAAGLRYLLDPPPPASAAPVRELGQPDLLRLAAWVAARGEGERNRGLFWATCRLAEAGLSQVDAQAVLGPAAERAGLPPREVSVTIRSAYRAVGSGVSLDEPSGDEFSPRRHGASTVRRVLS